MNSIFLLSLLPPSCIVVPIRDQRNITSSATSMSFNSLNFITEQDINMVTNLIKAMFNLDNNLDEVRGHSLDLSIYRPRSLSLSLSVSEDVKIKESGLSLFYFSFPFLFYF